MTTEEFEVVRDALIMAGTIPTETAVAVRDSLLILLRRDWARRVLDACVGGWEDTVPTPRRLIDGRWAIRGWDIAAPTPDAARLAVARAVFPTFSPKERAELGECP